MIRLLGYQEAPFKINLYASKRDTIWEYKAHDVYFVIKYLNKDIFIDFSYLKVYTMSSDLSDVFLGEE